MDISHRVACAFLLAAITGTTFAKDYYWNCTTVAGSRYADATQCDKGDTGIQVVKQGSSAQVDPATRAPTPAPANTVQALSIARHAPPPYCDQPAYGVVDASERDQAIAQFMRRKECEFFAKFPAHRVKDAQQP